MENIREILQKAINPLPGHLSGIDRLKAVGEIVRRLGNGERDPLRNFMRDILVAMCKKEASDIDLGGNGCGGRVWYRIQGDKRPDPSFSEFTPDETDVLCANLLTDSQLAYLLENRNLDFSYQTKADGTAYRYRADMYFDLDHFALNCRLIGNSIRPFKSLNLHPAVAKVLSLQTHKQGLTLVTGITGSGKSSTLDSIIDANNKSVDAHIVIIASPVETVHCSGRCIVRHREVGRDVRSFKEGAIQSLRQDPDIIVIGEMRDPDTIITALEITDSGHKVFSTLHTASAVESIDRIIAECRVEEQERVRMRLADTLICVISQKLIPSTDGKRVLAKEVMLMSPSIKAAIKNNNTNEVYQMINEGNEQGMNTLEQDLHRLVKEGRITVREAENYSNNKARMRELLGYV